MLTNFFLILLVYRLNKLIQITHFQHYLHISGNQWFRQSYGQIVERWPTLSTDLQDISETSGGDQGCTSAFVFQKYVGRDG